MKNPILKTELTTSSPGLHCFTIHIDKNIVDDESINRQNNQNSGSTPTEALKHENKNNILNDLIRGAFEEASIKHKLTPASAPEIRLLSDNSQDEYIFTATFEIIPLIDLSKLPSIEIKIPIVEVTDSDIDSTISAIFNQFPTREAALASLEIKETEIDELKNEVLSSLKLEAETYQNEIKKQAVISSVCDSFELSIPHSMVGPEIEKLIAAQDKTETPKVDQAELIAKATKNIQRGIIFNAVIQETHLSLEPKMVRKRVEKLSTTYENPDEVVKWYYSNRVELAGVEAKVIEEMIVDWIINSCNQSSYKMSFSEATTALS